MPGSIAAWAARMSLSRSSWSPSPNNATARSASRRWAAIRSVGATASRTPLVVASFLAAAVEQALSRPAVPPAAAPTDLARGSGCGTLAA